MAGIVLWGLAVPLGIDPVMDLGRRVTVLSARRLRAALREAQDLREQARALSGAHVSRGGVALARRDRRTLETPRRTPANGAREWSWRMA